MVSNCTCGSPARTRGVKSSPVWMYFLLVEVTADSEVSQLIEALKKNSGLDRDIIEQRKQKLVETHDRIRKEWQESAMKVAHDTPLDPQWVSHQLNQFLLLSPCRLSGLELWNGLGG